MATPLEELRTALGDGRGEIVDRWMEATRVRAWQLRGRPIDPQLRERAAAALEALAEALQAADELALGAPVFRESVQLFSFLAGWMAGAAKSISAAVALCHALRDVLGVPAPYLYDALVVVVGEAYAAGIEQAAQARHRQIIEKSQVVCILRERVVGLFLVGDPDREALDDAVGRLMMLAVMRNASSVVLDASGLMTTKPLPLAVSFVAEHREALAHRQVLLSGVAPESVPELAAGVSLDLRGFERLDHALAEIDASVEAVG